MRSFFLGIALCLQFCAGAAWAQSVPVSADFRGGAIGFGELGAKIHVYFAPRSVGGRLAICGIYWGERAGRDVIRQTLPQIGFRAGGRAMFMNATHFTELPDAQAAAKAQANCRVDSGSDWKDAYLRGGVEIIIRRFTISY